MRVPLVASLPAFPSPAAAVELVLVLPRLMVILGQVESIVARVDRVVTQIDQTQAEAAKTVGEATALVGRAGPLLDRFEPALDKLEPIVTRLAETTSPDEVDALVKLIDTLPELVEKMDDDILPILDTLGTVAPDLRDLLDVSKELNEILGSLPGLGRIKRRIEERHDPHPGPEVRP